MKEKQKEKQKTRVPFLTFGIPSLDELFYGREDDSSSNAAMADKTTAAMESEKSSTSLCIIGPDGTGKSVLALHLAASYFADCDQQRQASAITTLPIVLFVSTDLKFSMAEKMWNNFALDIPHGRRATPFHIPSASKQSTAAFDSLKLTSCLPLRKNELSLVTDDSQSLSEYLAKSLGTSKTDKEPSSGDEKMREVYFVDLASNTAGDDWGYINRVLSVLPKTENQPCHMMIIDSVEGFETLVGDKDAFGESHPRRSRIAQIMRSASDKCHIVFIVEEPKKDEILAEAFVTDVVIRLRSTRSRDYVRRTIEIEKARGQSYVRGEHPFFIRNGKPASTGTVENPDDPEVLRPDTNTHQGYFHVCHSLHKINRHIMKVAQGDAYDTEREEVKRNNESRFASFGIASLDSMLGRDEERPDAQDAQGLPCGNITALIGDPETQKSRLGRAFLSRSYINYIHRLKECYIDLINQQTTADTDFSASLIQKINAAAKQNWESVQDKDAKTFATYLEKKLQVFAAQPANTVIEELCTELKKICEPEKPSPAAAAPPPTQGEKQAAAFLKKRPHIKRIFATPDETINCAMKVASLLAGLSFHKEDGIAVLLTMHDLSTRWLVTEFLDVWLEEVLRDSESQLKEALRPYIEEHTICRRLEIHDMPAPVFTHIIQRTVERAQWLLFHHTTPPHETIKRMRQSWRIRLVIDDFSILSSAYPEVSNDPLVLPFLTFYLSREGITSLIIDTQTGRPDTPATEPLDSELRALAQYHLYTWRFPFYGSNRIAIAAIPPIAKDVPSVVRELRESSSNARISVDPRFELYAGIEEGNPRPVPLEIRLFAETPSIQQYIETENRQYNELFTALKPAKAGEQADVIVGVAGENYDQFKDFCHLQRDMRLDHTLIFQVDEFWELPQMEGRRASSALNLAAYLSRITTDPNSASYVDPFEVFQHTKALPSPQPKSKEVKKRHEFFDYQDCPLPDSNAGNRVVIDRIPFTKDFGFLLCRGRLWDDFQGEELPILSKILDCLKKKRGACNDVLPKKASEAIEKLSQNNRNALKKTRRYRTVGEVWENLPKIYMDEPADTVTGDRRRRASWREFFEACNVIARAQSLKTSVPVPAFDISMLSPESFCSLVLEIWASEIYNTKSKKKQFQQSLSTKSWKQADDGKGEAMGLLAWLANKDYRRALFKTWLLLVGAFDLNALGAATETAGLVKRADTNAVAARHWYKTACEHPENFSAVDPLVPVGLPGHFSVRGDWFLAVAGGSRSERLAKRALDLLSSKRANFSRFRQGYGLPTRNDLGEAPVRSKLYTVKKRKDEPQKTFVPRKSIVNNNDLLYLGSDKATQKNGFFWLWRSCLQNYHRHTRIWQEWLGWMILWWKHIHDSYEDEWMNGLQRYDEVCIMEEVCIVDEDDEKRFNDYLEEQVPSWGRFQEFTDGLLDNLKQATLDKKKSR